MKKEIDQETGIETTGHVWDGDLKELNNPLPRWWLTTFYACIAWAVCYWLLYPAWPGLHDYSRGLLGYSSRKAVTQAVAADQSGQSAYRSALLKTDLAAVKSDPELYHFATANGAAAFASNCAQCHGRGAQGAAGYPNLNDDDWLWGGGIEDIYRTIQFGIRSEHPDTRTMDMPKFGADKLLDAKQIGDVAEFVLSLSGRPAVPDAAARGGAIFAEQCTGCHGEKGTGNREVGAPNLTDGIWLYGGSRQDIVTTVETGRGGRMPAWSGRLDEATLRSLAIYVASLGGSN